MKKIVFLALTLLLLAALCVGIGFSAMAADTNNVNALEQTIMAGYALPEIPSDARPISNSGQFREMTIDGVYYLTADIELSSTYPFAFSGTLYGNGHTVTVNGTSVFFKLTDATVRDLTVAGTVTGAENAFSYVGGLACEAYNTNLVGVTNKAPIHQDWKEWFAGGIVGYAENTTFKYCVNYGNITGHTDAFRPGGIMGQCDNDAAWIVLENCINYGTVNGRNQTGGLISRIEHGSSLRMTDCANFGTINVAGTDSGGLIGKVSNNATELTFERCYNSGRINGGTNSGGISGPTAASKMTVTDCYNGCFVDDCDCNGTEHGYITQKGAGDIGGLIASFNQSGHAEVELLNCFNYGEIYTTFSSRIGGIAGCMETKTFSANNCHNYGDLNSASYGGGLFSRAGCTEGTLLVENCSNSGNFTTNSYGGGIIGYEQYSPAIKMVNCVNNGTITTNWNAGGILCRIDGNLSPKPGGMEFINCVNNGNVTGNGGTAGGILGIMETRSEAEKNADKGLFTEETTGKVAYLIFTNCSNTGDVLSPNYAGGMTGIAWAVSTTMTNCTNSGDMMLKPDATDYAEVGGLAGRLWGSLTATDCVNTGDICPTAMAATRTASIVMGGIVGRVGVDYVQKDTDKKEHTFDYTKNHFATFTNCINTGTLGGSKAIADAATTYASAAGGIIGDSNGKCTAKNCVSTGDIFCNQQAGGISALAGQNNVGASTYEGCVVTGYIYNSGHKTTYNSAGAAGISCYVWGNANVKRCTVTSDIYVGTSGSSKAMADRWACAVLVGYTNNNGGVFQYNYFTGELKKAGGNDCYLVFVGNTKGSNVTSDEGGDINHNYSVNEYNLHANQSIGYSASKTTSKTTAEMVALSSDFLAVRYCDGVEFPINKETRVTYATALNAAGHNMTVADVDGAQHGGVCTCGAVVYENHEYDNPCDTECNTCGHVRTVADHEGLYDCSTTCKHCGVAMTAKSAHTGAQACSATCRWCGTDIENPADHTTLLLCDTSCSLCGASVDAEEEHTGLYTCSEACQWCGTPVTGAKHQGKYACSFTCETCGTDLNNSLPHVGEQDCSDTCKYCGGDIVPQSDHIREYECSNACKLCGVSLSGEHAGETDCATKCQYCGVAIIPTESHTTDPLKPCSEKCTLCGETTVATQLHTYDADCALTCSVCGYTRGSATDHDYSAACDATCNQCGFERSASHDPGVQRCADTCMYCHEKLEELGVALIPCAGEFACSETCQWCGGAVADPAEHTTAYDCDTVCSVCDGAVDSEGHTGLYPCSVTCRYCEMEIEAAGDHKYTDGCDDTCNNCLQKTRNADHRYNNNCDADCNRCGAIRVPADHVYSNACDAECNSCNLARTPAEHVYDDPCKDMDCNECGELRTPDDHTYDGCTDADCNGCGTTRTATSHNYEGVEWVVVTPATTEADGVQERACATCGVKETQAITKLTSGNEGGSMILGLERDTFIIIAGAAAAVILVIVIVVGVVVSKKKKAKKKAQKAAEAVKAEKPQQTAEETALVEEQEVAEQEASETEAPQGEQE